MLLLFTIGAGGAPAAPSGGKAGRRRIFMPARELEDDSDTLALLL